MMHSVHRLLASRERLSITGARVSRLYTRLPQIIVRYRAVNTKRREAGQRRLIFVIMPINLLIRSARANEARATRW